jgi:hypothetical protein
MYMFGYLFTLISAFFALFWFLIWDLILLGISVPVTDCQNIYVMYVSTYVSESIYSSIRPTSIHVLYMYV